MKMIHPNADRPLSVQPEDVAKFEALGWRDANPKPEPVEPAVRKAPAKKAAPRKSTK